MNFEIKERINMSGSNKRVSKNFEKWEENVESLGKSKKLTTLEFLKKFTTGHSCSFHSLERFSKSIKQAMIINGRKADKKQVPSSSNVISPLKKAIKEVKNWSSYSNNKDQKSIATNTLESFFRACKKYESALKTWCATNDEKLNCPAILDLVTHAYLKHVDEPMLTEKDTVQIKQQSI